MYVFYDTYYDGDMRETDASYYSCDEGAREYYFFLFNSPHYSKKISNLLWE